MKGMKKLTKKERYIYLSVASCFFIMLSALFTYFKPLSTLDYLVSDFFYQSLVEKKENASNIKIISIDDKTIEKLGSFSSWSRSETAKLIEFLDGSSDKPDVIAFGLDYHNKLDTKGDNELIASCSKYDNICISSTVVTEDKNACKYIGNIAYPQSSSYVSAVRNANISVKAAEKISAVSDDIKETDIKEHTDVPLNKMGGEDIKDILTPFDGILPYIKTGVINTGRNDDDGYIRNMVASINHDGTSYDSFALAVYQMYLNKNDMEYKAPVVGDMNEFGINYSRNARNFDIYSFYDVISGNIDAKEFNNSIVLVGDYTADSVFYVPNHRASHINEIELQANIINALLQNNTIYYAHKWFLFIWYAIFAVLFFIATTYNSGINTIVYSVTLIILQILASCLLNVWGYYIPLLRLIILIIAVAVVNLLSGYLIVRRQRYYLEKAFKKYVDEQVVDEIVKKDGEIKASIGGTRKDIAVLFVDIRGFTPLSEKLSPEHVVEILNRYLTIVADAVAANGGTLDKFIGDAAMAVYNSPSDQEDYVFRAVCTAWDILSDAASLKKECLEKYGKKVEFGIGVNCGDAVIGNIGSQNRMEYTAIGDTVNTTSRLEGVAGPGQILISSEVAKRLGNRIDISFAGEYSLKGKKKKVNAFEINGIREAYEPVKRVKSDEKKSLEEKYEEGKKEIKKVHEKYVNELQNIKEFTENELKEGIKQKTSAIVKGGK